MASFEDIYKAYLRKIGEEEGNTSRSIEQDIDHIGEVYWRICRDTGCTYVPPTLVSLSGVTATTNKHALATALSLSSGEEVFGVKSVLYGGDQRLVRWNKDIIEQYNIGYGGGGDARAYAIFDEMSSGVKTTYISFYPYVASANTTDYRISYFLRPVKPTSTAYATEYPSFSDDWHWLISELAALETLRDLGDNKFTHARWADVVGKINEMAVSYVSRIHTGEKIASPLGNRDAQYRYDEWSWSGNT